MGQRRRDRTLAASFFWFTPLRPWQALIAGALIAMSSVLGRVVIICAIAIQHGRPRWGEVTGRNQGVLDRLDGVVYAAPVFFHFVQFITIR